MGLLLWDQAFIYCRGDSKVNYCWFEVLWQRAQDSRSDAEEIFDSSDVQLFLSDQGIKHQYSVPYEHYQNRVERLIQHNIRGISSLMYSQKWLPASYWEYAAKHFVRVSRFVPTKKSSPSTPSNLIGAGDLDLSVKFPFSFGDFVAVRIPDAEVRWKFDLRRDLGIYLGDADDTKRGYSIVHHYGSIAYTFWCCLSSELWNTSMVFRFWSCLLPGLLLAACCLRLH